MVKYKYHMFGDDTKFSDLVGQTLVRVEHITDNSDPAWVSDDVLHFVTENGDVYGMYHRDDCCENVWVEDICGDLDDLAGSPIISASVETNEDDPLELDYTPESFTWTFYKIATIKGSVTIRWFGESNGYYSEDVDFVKLAEGGE